MRFRVDLKIFLFLIIFYLTKQIHIYALIMIFALIHELGHLFAGILCGMKPEKLEIKSYGVSVSFKLFPKDYNIKIGQGNKLEIKKIIVALVGPLTNLLIIIVSLNLQIEIFTKLMIIYSNILIIIFNLIPIYPLDGGRIAKSILHIIYGKRKSEKYINNISFVSLIIVTFISSILIYMVENIAIFIIVIVLWIMYIAEDIKYKRRIEIYNLLEKSIEINSNK